MVEEPPFSVVSQLYQLELELLNGKSINTSSKHLPSQPRIKLDDIDTLKDFLSRDLCTPVLDRLAPHLYLIATPSSSNISPLHFQKVKNRRVILTEDPKLHLVWYHDRIFVKPLPAYLLSHTFWQLYLCRATSPLRNERQHVAKAALGLLRSYCRLIEHESDLRIAQREDLQLVPKAVTWEQFCQFSASFSQIEDTDVAPRYQYGDLRLGLLNYLVKLFFIGSCYQEVNWQYSEYFAQFYGPLLFIFGVLSVLLSAMQVSLAVEQLQPQHWATMYKICRWFSVATLCVLAGVSGWLIGLVIWRPLDQLAHTVKMKRRKSRSPKSTATKVQLGKVFGRQAATV